MISYLGIDTSKEFSVNGMRYHKDENGCESEANRAAQDVYERFTANNRTYLLADERTKKQIAYISDYYLENTTEKLKEAWQKTLEETSVNPFPEGFQTHCHGLLWNRILRQAGMMTFSAVTWKATSRV